MNDKAMSLIEIVVSMVILMILALGVLSISTFLGAGPKSKGYLATQATNYARETAEWLKNSVSRNATTAAPLLQGTGRVHTLSPANNRLGAGATRTYDVQDVVPLDPNSLPRYKRVTVRVTWLEPT